MCVKVQGRVMQARFVIQQVFASKKYMAEYFYKRVVKNVLAWMISSQCDSTQLWGFPVISECKCPQTTRNLQLLLHRYLCYWFQIYEIRSISFNNDARRWFVPRYEKIAQPASSEKLRSCGFIAVIPV